ncbi:hypothetical protein [Yinghuangia seranimata]|uniref:hypothetical protein n=1 Tax=Yinghuangia seranimata TaxID=408067 RepID=UPI00248BF70D|nr:hypothetical protein [Yinghuangia seranimata]MDI2127916.1 hypothetical protein [Yinghuangia seranimata]
MRSVRGAAVLVVVAVLAAIGFVVFAKDGGKDSNASPTKHSGPAPDPSSSSASGGPRKEVPIGDGSTADTGPQPNQPKTEKLKPGEKPPQFVVFSWDGAAEMDGVNLVTRFRKVARESNAYMTLFLSGIYVLPESKKALYQGPQHGVGASDIEFLYDKNEKATIKAIRDAWLEGDEVGTHFNGHFCGAKGGDHWSVDEWKKEIDQVYSFVQNWRTNSGWTDVPSLPFDYKKELIGGRAPCLEGQKTLIPAAKQYGWRYDASSKGGNQVWPKKIDGLWDLPLQSLPWPGSPTKTQLSMDYNIMAEQTNAKKDAPKEQWDALRKQATDFYLGGFNRAYTTNRAPLFIGNHFETWNGGVYMDAVENTMRTVCKKDGVRCVSFRQFVDWLDAQDPAVVAKLQGLGLGQTPADWGTVTGGSGAPVPPAGSAPYINPPARKE